MKIRWILGSAAILLATAISVQAQVGPGGGAPGGLGGPGATPAPSDMTLTTPGATPTNPDATPTNPDATPTNPGATPTNPGATPTNPGATPDANPNPSINQNLPSTLPAGQPPR